MPRPNLDEIEKYAKKNADISKICQQALALSEYCRTMQQALEFVALVATQKRDAVLAAYCKKALRGE